MCQDLGGLFLVQHTALAHQKAELAYTSMWMVHSVFSICSKLTKISKLLKVRKPLFTLKRSCFFFHHYLHILRYVSENVMVEILPVIPMWLITLWAKPWEGVNTWKHNSLHLDIISIHSSHWFKLSSSVPSMNKSGFDPKYLPLKIKSIVNRIKSVSSKL